MADNPFAPALLIEERGPIRIVTINRPEAMNAVDERIHRGFANIWRHLAADRGARAVVLTGAGKAFSAGGDMVLFQKIQKDPVERTYLIDEARTVFNELIDFPCCVTSSTWPNRRTSPIPTSALASQRVMAVRRSGRSL
jgi:enoyl-CoA hydratase